MVLVSFLSLDDYLIIQMWYADSSVRGGKLLKIKEWWDELNIIGPSNGYYPNAKKTKLLVKEEFKELAWAIFRSCDIDIWP